MEIDKTYIIDGRYCNYINNFKQVEKDITKLLTGDSIYENYLDEFIDVSMLSEIKKGNVFYSVSSCCEEIVCVASFVCLDNGENEYELEQIVTKEGFRDKGIAKLTMIKAINYIRNISLNSKIYVTVFLEDKVLYNLLKSLGFVQIQSLSVDAEFLMPDQINLMLTV